MTYSHCVAGARSACRGAIAGSQDRPSCLPALKVQANAKLTIEPPPAALQLPARCSLHAARCKCCWARTLILQHVRGFKHLRARPHRGCLLSSLAPFPFHCSPFQGRESLLKIPYATRDVCGQSSLMKETTPLIAEHAWALFVQASSLRHRFACMRKAVPATQPCFSCSTCRRSCYEDSRNCTQSGQQPVPLHEAALRLAEPLLLLRILLPHLPQPLRPADMGFVAQLPVETRCRVARVVPAFCRQQLATT